jgi:hypothetical protein
MIWLGAETFRQVKIIDKNNFVGYIEPQCKNWTSFLGRRSGPQFYHHGNVDALQPSNAYFLVTNPRRFEPDGPESS